MLQKILRRIAQFPADKTLLLLSRPQCIGGGDGFGRPSISSGPKCHFIGCLNLGSLRLPIRQRCTINGGPLPGLGSPERLIHETNEMESGPVSSGERATTILMISVPSPIFFGGCCKGGGRAVKAHHRTVRQPRCHSRRTDGERHATSAPDSMSRAPTTFCPINGNHMLEA